MKPKIAPEIDALMWHVAETRDPDAIGGFEKRFPELATEMRKRVIMVRELKAAGKAVPKPKYVPTFQPRQETLGWRRDPRRALIGAVVLALFAVAGAAFMRFGMPGNSGSSTSQKPSPPLPVAVGPSANPNLRVAPVAQGQSSDRQPNFRGVHKEVSKTGDEQTGAQPPKQKYEPPRFDAHMESASIETALITICRQAGFDYEIAPGMPDVQVTFDFKQMSASQMLYSLGHQYGFTPLKDGRRRVLFVPAVDSTGYNEDVDFGE